MLRDSQSMKGTFITIKRIPIGWKLLGQRNVSLSSAESEYVALSSGALYFTSVRRLYTKILQSSTLLFCTNLIPIVILDNIMTSISLSQSEFMNART